MAGTKADAERFSREWAGKGDENQDTQRFWIGLLQDVLGVDDAIQRIRFEVPVQTDASDHNGYVDVLIPSARVIVEQKSLGIDLSKPEKRQGRMVTPAQQALAYAQGMPSCSYPSFPRTSLPYSSSPAKAPHPQRSPRPCRSRLARSWATSTTS